MRLLHPSDWHIGRQLHGVSLIEDQAHVLDQIVDIAEREYVEAVIIAGDISHGGNYISCVGAKRADGYQNRSE